MSQVRTTAEHGDLAGAVLILENCKRVLSIQNLASSVSLYCSFYFLLNHLDLEADKLHAGALEGPARMGEVTDYFLRGLVRMCMHAQSLSHVQKFVIP